MAQTFQQAFADRPIKAQTVTGFGDQDASSRRVGQVVKVASLVGLGLIATGVLAPVAGIGLGAVFAGTYLLGAAEQARATRTVPAADKAEARKKVDSIHESTGNPEGKQGFEKFSEGRGKRFLKFLNPIA